MAQRGAVGDQQQLQQQQQQQQAAAARHRGFLDERLERYLWAHTREPPLLARLRDGGRAAARVGLAARGRPGGATWPRAEGAARP